MVTRLPESPLTADTPKLAFDPTDRLPVRGDVIYTPHAPNPAGMKHTLHNYYPLLLAKLKAETGFNLTHYKQVVEGGGGVGFKPLSNLSTTFYLWVVTEVLQVNTASKTWNFLEPRAWKVVLPNHMLLKRKFCYDPRVRHKQG